MNIDKSTATTLAMLALLLGIGIAGHYASPFLLPKADLRIEPVPGCDLQRETCAAVLSDGARIELSLAPRPIPFLTPLKVDVAAIGLKANTIEVDFAGESMNMGYNRVTLAATGDARHSGEASLPVCVSGGMNWIATVLVETDRQRIAVPYRFAVGY